MLNVCVDLDYDIGREKKTDYKLTFDRFSVIVYGANEIIIIKLK